MMEIEQIAALFHIHEKASAHGQNFLNIKEAAWNELKKLDEQHKIEKPSTFVPTALDKEIAGTEAGGVERREL